TTIVIVIASVIAWPFRRIWWLLTRKPRGAATAARLIVVGFDGQEPSLTEQFMTEGRLPNFSALRGLGCYRRLRTTFPPLSPVAWSSFSPGGEPARHNIYDFIEPDRRTYLPRLTGTRIGRVERFLR